MNNNETMDYGLLQLRLQEAAFSEGVKTPPPDLFSKLNLDNFTIEDVYRMADIHFPLKN